MDAKERFKASVPLQALTIKPGHWRGEVPPVKKLQEHALVWNAIEYHTLRETVREPRATAAIVTTSDPDKIRGVDITAGDRTVARVFIYKAAGEVPATAEAVPVRLVVVHVPPESKVRLTPQVLRLLEKVPVLIYGAPALVRAIGAEVGRAVEERARRDVDVWVRPSARPTGLGADVGGGLLKRSLLIFHGHDMIERQRVCDRPSPSKNSCVSRDQRGARYGSPGTHGYCGCLPVCMRRCAC